MWPIGDVAAELAEDLFVEDGAKQAHLFVRADRAAVGGGDARRLLAAVLQRVEREVREASCVATRSKDPRYPAHVLRVFYSAGGLPAPRLVVAAPAPEQIAAGQEDIDCIEVDAAWPSAPA